MESWPLVLHAASTWALVGLIWTIHVVHYPMFAHVGDRFRAVHEQHMRAITPVVGPFMLMELGTGVWVWAHPIPGVEPLLFGVGLALLAAVWLVTALFAVPAHGKLEGGSFDPKAHRMLMRADLARTLLWTARGVLLAYLMVRVLAEAAAP